MYCFWYVGVPPDSSTPHRFVEAFAAGSGGPDASRQYAGGYPSRYTRPCIYTADIHGKAVLLTEPIGQLAYTVIIHSIELVELVSVHKGNRVKDDVRVDMLFICMGCDHCLELLPKQHLGL